MRIRSPSYNTVLGPQYLVDCDLNDYGCGGGWPTTAMSKFQDKIFNFIESKIN